MSTTKNNHIISNSLNTLIQQRISVPSTIQIEAEHGITEDIEWVCKLPNQQENFEEQFKLGLQKNGIDLSAFKQRVYKSTVTTNARGTTITYWSNKESTASEIYIKNVVLITMPPRNGGGAFNVSQNLDVLISGFSRLIQRYPNLSGMINNLPEVEFKTILSEGHTQQIQYDNIKIKKKNGRIRVSNIFTVRDDKYYFAQKEAHLEKIEPLPILPSTVTPVSLVLQQMTQEDLKRIVSIQFERYLDNLDFDNIFWLLTSDQVKSGDDINIILETLKHTAVLCCNLFELSQFIRAVPIGKYSPKAERDRIAKIGAQQIHSKGVKTLVVTDEAHGTYVSVIIEEKIYWKKTTIDYSMVEWIDQNFRKLNKYHQKKKIILPPKQLNTVGCGDAYSAAIQFGVQYLGLMDWDFVFTFANKIAGLNARCSESNLHSIDPDAIADLFEESLKNKDQLQWDELNQMKNYSDPFQDFQKKQNIQYLQNKIYHEIIILIGPFGSGRRTITQNIQKNEKLIKELINSGKRILSKSFIINSTTVLTDNDFSDDGTEKGSRSVSVSTFDKMMDQGKLVGVSRVNEKTRAAFALSKFTFYSSKNADKHTLDFVFASTREAIDLWEEMMEKKEVTQVKIVCLSANEHELRKRLKKRYGDDNNKISNFLEKNKHHDKREHIAEQSGGFVYTIQPGITPDETTHALLRAVFNQIHMDIEKAKE